MIDLSENSFQKNSLSILMRKFLWILIKILWPFLKDKWQKRTLSNPSKELKVPKNLLAISKKKSKFSWCNAQKVVEGSLMSILSKNIKKYAKKCFNLKEKFLIQLLIGNWRLKASNSLLLHPLLLLKRKRSKVPRLQSKNKGKFPNGSCKVQLFELE